MKNRFKTNDSALAYFVNQLDNLDQRLYMPLVDVSWGRDIKLRSGISMSNESSSFIRTKLAAPGTLSQGGGVNGGNMSFISAETNNIPGVSVNGERIVKPLRLLAREISYTSVELNRSSLLGQSIDAQKMDGLNMVYQMNTDQMVYIGAQEVGATGLLNSADVTAANVVNGAGGSPLWANKTPDEILADVNTLLTASWEASAFAVCPDKLILPGAQFGLIATKKVSDAGNLSILNYIRENSVCAARNGRPLDIVPVKWAKGRGASNTDRMMAYTNAEDRVRFPMVPIRRETPYYQGIRFTSPYVWAFGEVEFVYPETARYADGI